MREILIISGKGGTGKTSLTGAFAHLAHNKITCDLDVDAPDLHLLLHPKREREEDFYSGHEAVIDPEKCTNCGLCASMCQYEAIREHSQGFSVDSLRCEGCKVCVTFCPEEAIQFPERHCGKWFLSTTRFGPLVHAQLFPGEENSGKLVILLKKQARELAATSGADLILCDGAPGIGCPVISSFSGADLAIAVTEPTPSGRHDLERVADLCRHFQISLAVIINKFDLNPEETARIEALCRERGHPMLARLPHDPLITRAMIQGLVVTELPDTDFSRKIKQAWAGIEELAGLRH
ncbi:ATP-binding protein [Desulfobacca acetoxidans]|uniref:Cobyrinic acid ac-diamide synthase n=1 Tax=Desulfobacca acetoxidans (strain ATCC 700848 / DSM 11109 / ASRB2) TaxID=880072 RepID=F2NIF4_DESAR|nr:ATP-binding protein [Desulfobacca acetoxidans]AEB10356.1 Cobyrinic acid ac-diamide synthase [Desulfobacca acetoxidans DSM 11109]